MFSRGMPATMGIAALVAIALAPQGCGSMTQAPGTINGVVYAVDDAGNQKPGPPGAARISLFDADSGNIVATTDSGGDGTFHFSVPAGKYSVSGGGRAEYVRVDSGKAADVRVAVPAEQK
jgi:hypothetical protein